MATVQCATSADGPDGEQAWDHDLVRIAAPLLDTLPHGASMCLLRALNGLSPHEGEVLCAKVATLKVEKQFRVIHAMSVSTLEGKRKFLQTLVRKVEAKQQQERRSLGMEPRPGRDPDPDLDVDPDAKMNLAPDARRREPYRHAVDRVRRLNPTAKHHSFNAALGPGIRNMPPIDANDDSWLGLHSSALAPIPEHAPLLVPPRASSMSSLETTPTTSMSHLGRLLANTHITESERNLRELERHCFKKACDKDHDVEMTDVGASTQPESSKRARSDSARVLAMQEQKPQQRPRVMHRSKPDPVWTAAEDQLLTSLVCQGRFNWREISERVAGRSPKECRGRWINHLDPTINRTPFTPTEDTLLLQAYEKLGSKWSQLAVVLKGRSEDAIKTRWKILTQQRRASWS